MKTSRIVSRSFLALLAVSLIGASFAACADDFPDAFIAKGLAEAKNPVTVDVSQLAEGKLLSVNYAGRPVYIYRRTAADITALEHPPAAKLVDADGKFLLQSIRHEYGSSSSTVWARLLLLAQPITQQRPYRSLDKTLLVVAGWSPESGCVLEFVSDPQQRTDPAAIFSDVCTGAKFDTAGRVFAGLLMSNKFASNNLAVPPYHFDAAGKLVLGPASGQTIPELNFPLRDLYQNLDATKLLVAAASFNDMDTVRAALQKGANAAYYRVRERSPIDAAVLGSSIDIVKLLIAHGAKPTPNTLALAKLVDRPEVIALLQPPNSGAKPK